MTKGTLELLCGPSGVGKTTNQGNLKSYRWVTRPPRRNETGKIPLDEAINQQQKSVFVDNSGVYANVDSFFDEWSKGNLIGVHKYPDTENGFLYGYNKKDITFALEKGENVKEQIVSFEPIKEISDLIQAKKTLVLTPSHDVMMRLFRRGFDDSFTERQKLMKKDLDIYFKNLEIFDDFIFNPYDNFSPDHLTNYMDSLKNVMICGIKNLFNLNEEKIIDIDEFLSVDGNLYNPLTNENYFNPGYFDMLSNYLLEFQDTLIDNHRRDLISLDDIGKVSKEKFFNKYIGLSGCRHSSYVDDGFYDIIIKTMPARIALTYALAKTINNEHDESKFLNLINYVPNEVEEKLIENYLKFKKLNLQKMNKYTAKRNEEILKEGFFIEENYPDENFEMILRAYNTFMNMEKHKENPKKLPRSYLNGAIYNMTREIIGVRENFENKKVFDLVMSKRIIESFQREISYSSKQDVRIKVGDLSERGKVVDAMILYQEHVIPVNNVFYKRMVDNAKNINLDLTNELIKIRDMKYW